MKRFAAWKFWAAAALVNVLAAVSYVVRDAPSEDVRLAVTSAAFCAYIAFLHAEIDRMYAEYVSLCAELVRVYRLTSRGKS